MASAAAASVATGQAVPRTGTAVCHLMAREAGEMGGLLG
jgi:hypothetical protein